MINWAPVTQRVTNIRHKYRTTKPKIDISRYRLVTEFYMNNPQYTGILKRAKNLYNLFENMPVLVNENEVIVGWQGSTYRCCALYPETSFKWFMEELRAGIIRTRSVDPYDLDPEDEKYLLETGDYWAKNSVAALFDEYVPQSYRDNMDWNGAVGFNREDNVCSPVGHFNANFWKATRVGFGAIRDEANAKMKELEENGIFGDSANKYNFYRAVSIVCDGLILWSKRYARECLRQAEECSDSARKEELLRMADTLNWIMENPCRNFLDAMQCVYLYQLAMCLDGQLHGISFGRLDQFVGEYYEKDLEEGKITPEYAQEIVDLFMLKVAEINKIWSEIATMSNPGYTTGQLVTIGGVDKEGNDATNPVTYMILSTHARLFLHSPPLALRIHENTPDSLWELALETTKRNGGVPTFESDRIIIPTLMKRGIPLEDARNYCLFGCVEPGVGGYEWAQPGGTGTESYINIANIMLMAINNGYNPTPARENNQFGLPTGYLYEMNSMDEVMDAVNKQMIHFCKWQASNINMWETISSYHTPIPLASATFEGCMESGKDVQCGGAKYNSTGNSCIGLGNVADSLNMIDQVCFRKKLATTRELYDAIMNNWKGYEELQQIIKGKLVHYGNNDSEADKYVEFAGRCYAEAINRCTGPRGGYAAGCYPVTVNVMFGYGTGATPDGRSAGEPLADGISPVQSTDKNGPISTLSSILKFDQSLYGNGTLCNMKIHPTSLQGETGNMKLKSVMETYFEQGGMELQLNIVSSDILRKAQQNPEDYKDLVVRVAGFSAYFVEVFKDCQNDLIKRTELCI